MDTSRCPQLGLDEEINRAAIQVRGVEAEYAEGRGTFCLARLESDCREAVELLRRSRLEFTVGANIPLVS